MSPGARCDEILRLIDETLATAGAAEERVTRRRVAQSGDDRRRTVADRKLRDRRVPRGGR
jgi:hypothetical protein